MQPSSSVNLQPSSMLPHLQHSSSRLPWLRPFSSRLPLL
jgi:hypothetical protein